MLLVPGPALAAILQLSAVQVTLLPSVRSLSTTTRVFVCLSKVNRFSALES